MESGQILEVLLLRNYWPCSKLGRKKTGDFVPIQEGWHNLANISSSSNGSIKMWYTRSKVKGQARLGAGTLRKVVEYHGQDEFRGKLIAGTVTYWNKRR